MSNKNALLLYFVHNLVLLLFLCMVFLFLLCKNDERAFRSGVFCSVFSQKNLAALKTKFELSTTFRSQDITLKMST